MLLYRIELEDFAILCKKEFEKRRLNTIFSTSKQAAIWTIIREIYIKELLKKRWNGKVKIIGNSSDSLYYKTDCYEAGVTSVKRSSN